MRWAEPGSRGIAPWGGLVLLLGVACHPGTPSAGPQDGPTSPPDGTTEANRDRSQTGPSSATHEPSQAPPVTLSGDSETVAAKRAAVDDACARVCEDEAEVCRCAVERDLGNWLVLRASQPLAAGTRWLWFVMGSDLGWSLRAPEDVDLPPHRPAHESYRLCEEHSETDAPPSPGGVIATRVEDLTADGRADLRLECDGVNLGRHYLRVCVAGEDRCTEVLWLHERESGALVFDGDVEFVDGWIMRTVRSNDARHPAHDMALPGVTTPFPGRS